MAKGTTAMSRGREAAGTVVTRLTPNQWSRIVHLADEGQPDTVDGTALEHLLGRRPQR
jgi:hypothetical protein